MDTVQERRAGPGSSFRSDNQGGGPGPVLCRSQPPCPSPSIGFRLSREASSRPYRTITLSSASRFVRSSASRRRRSSSCRCRRRSSSCN